jgi:hypothetical protein
VVPKVAAALLDLPVGEATLRECSGFDSTLLRPDGTAVDWRQSLFDEKPKIAPTTEVYSARTLAAALGAAVNHVKLDSPKRSAWMDRLRTNGLALLPDFGTEGHLGNDDPEPIDTGGLADALLTDLFEQVT